MRKLYIILLLIICILYPQYAQTQVPVTKSTEIQIIDGNPFYIHEVQKGQTLYSISKAYQCTVDEIKASNRISEQSLQVGYLLKIPAKTTKADELKVINSGKGTYESGEHIVERGESLYSIAQKYSTTVELIRKLNPGISDNLSVGQKLKVPVTAKPVSADDLFVFHVVESGETLYGIAKKYLLTINQIKSLNPDINENITIGQQIIVGKKGEIDITSDTIYDCKKSQKLNTYNVALLIPLYLDQSNFRTFNKDDKDKNEWYQNISFRFIQFYEGFKFALDTMQSLGMNVNLYVYDLDESEAKLSKVLNNPAMKTMHLIIGPFYEKFLDTISQFSYANKIPMVNCFLSGQIDLKELNPYFFNPLTSVRYQMKGLADFFKSERSDANIIIAYQSGGFEEKAALTLDSYLKENSNNSWSMVNLTETGLKGATGKFVGGKRENILVMFASGELYVENIVRSLNDYKEKFVISLYGLPTWLNYDVIDLEFLEFQNTHFYSSSFIDYESAKVRNFAKRFQKQYKVDPDRFAFAGYDIGLYFLSALKNYGTQFYKCIDEHKVPLLATELNFEFSKTDGYRNTYVSIYKMKDFQLWKIK